MPCPVCNGERVWWPTDGDAVFSQLCPWCDDIEATADPDDTALHIPSDGN